MRLLFFLFFSATSAIAFSQSRGYAGYIRLGTMSIHDARSVLPELANGISGFTSSFSGIGGELEYRAKRTVIGAELMILSQGPHNSGADYAEPFTGAAMLKTGYAVVDKKSFIIYPNAGVGFGTVVLNTYQKSGNLKKQLHSIYLIEPVFDLGLSSDVIIYRFKRDMPSGILPVGIRAGYRFAFDSNDWHRTNGSDLSKTNYSITGWYFSVALGIGYITSN
jgi:hypothetical protein